jgi:ubiquinone/menaquinone biosynthesis C-methylase UbiE
MSTAGHKANRTVSPALAGAYDEQYAEELAGWREIGGKYKARNIVEVCRGRQFRKVLDCGAGEGSILKFLDAAAAFDELYAIEISESGIERIRGRDLPRLREARKFDGYEIPYPDDCFDMAYCSHVIEHVEHPRILLRELGRVSRFQVFEVPLDYSVGVDRRTRDFLSYGHINIYTPSLFRFLLNSEGFEILADKLSYAAAEVERYNWYRNLKLKPSLVRELLLRLDPLRRLVRRIQKGRAGYEEYHFSAYTCLATRAGGLRILAGC